MKVLIKKFHSWYQSSEVNVMFPREVKKLKICSVCIPLEVNDISLNIIKN